MPEGSGGPQGPSSANVPGAPPAGGIDPARLHEQRSVGLPPLPAERLESAVEAFSRFAGPAAFFFVLGTIVWLVFR